MINAAERDSAASGNCSSSWTSRARAARATASRASSLHHVLKYPRGRRSASHPDRDRAKAASARGRTLPEKGRWCLVPVAHRTRTPDRTPGGQTARYDRDWRQTGGCRSVTGGQRSVLSRKFRTGTPGRESTRWCRYPVKNGPARRRRRRQSHRRSRLQCASDRADYAWRRSGCFPW